MKAGGLRSFLAILRPRAFSTLLAWGRNAEGQTGIESALIVSRPTPVLELHGTALRCLVASKLSSGAVSAAGEAYTWGEGRCGKLGHGSADNMHAPTRVEALVGRADVCGMVQGDQHLLLLDQQGAVWACGENKEGQCGLGTPLEVIAAQHRRSFYDSLRPLAPGEGRPGSRPLSMRPASPSASAADSFRQRLRALINDKKQQQQQGGWSGQGTRPAPITPAAAAAAAQPAHPPAASATQAGATRGGQRHGSEAGKEVLVAAAAAAARGAPEAGAWGSWPHLSRSAGDSSQASAALLSPGGVPLAAQLTASGLTPGCVHTPTRIGRDQHPLGEAHHAAALSPSGLRLVGASGLEQERVVGLAASRHFSVAVTAAGEVWTWGACYNGALGTHSSWSTSAQKVCGALAQAIGDAGGAIRAVAGGTFCAVLTANGKVLLWGKLPGPEVGSADVLQVAEGLAMTLGARLVVGEVPGLPPIRHLVAGQQHLLLSDGERVWSIGRGLDAAGQEASLAPWSRPEAVLSCAAEGVASLAAGAHSSAAVTGDGRLWMWGRLLDLEHVRGLRQRHQAMRMDPEGGEGEGWGEEGREGGSSTWQWPGFGAPHPQLVEGLGGRVRGVALGGWHALALVD